MTEPVQSLATYRAQGFDGTPMNAQMPEMNGLDAARVVRTLDADGKSPPTPIIVLTANVTSHQTQQTPRHSARRARQVGSNCNWSRSALGPSNPA